MKSPPGCLLFSLLFSHLFPLLLSSGIKDPDDPPPVIIRLDDVTAGWCEEQSKLVIDTLIELDTPVNVGLIGSDLEKSELLSASGYLGEVAKSPLVEMASHSYSHDSFQGQTYEWQENDLAQLNDVSNKLTSKIPMTFIPPKNEWDDTTIMALQNNTDMHILSGQCNWTPGTNQKRFCQTTSLLNLDVVAPNIKVGDLYVLPAGAVMGDTAYWNNYLLPASVANATAWIESQIANQGFAVLMLHPVEFAIDSTCASIDKAKVDVLSNLVASNTATTPSGKWRFMRYGDAVEYLSGDVVVQSEREYQYPDGHQSPILPIFVVLGGILLFMQVSCACSYFSPEIKKIKDCCCCRSGS